MSHYLKKVIKLRLLHKVIKADGIDRLTKLFMSYVHGETLSDEAMISRLNEHFNNDQKVVYYDQEYKQILDVAKRVYLPAKKLPDHQLQSLTETIYQKSLNLFHLKDYADRGTNFVQVKAILDSSTTQQCRQMNGRIFPVPALQKEIPNQTDIVHDNDWWENAGFFKQIPTSEMTPLLPPYHYNCRTRIVPYIKPNDPVKALQDKFDNYEVTNDDVPGVISLASKTEWKPGKLDDHVNKHIHHFGEEYYDAAEYHQGINELLNASDKHIGLVSRKSNNHLLLMAWQDIPESDSKSKRFAIFDLTSGHILSYYKKGLKKILSQFDDKYAAKAILFKAEETIMKHEYIPEDYSLDMMLAILTEYDLINYYDTLPIVIQYWDEDGLLHAEDPMDYRRDVLQPLAKLGKLTDDQIQKVNQVDKYVISASVPEEMQEFQAWLKLNPLTNV